jgi:glycosyltransferase involved in cell wall biosynthesis
MSRTLLFLTTADPASTPHAEWIPWALQRAGWNVTVVAPGEQDSVLRKTLGAKWSWRSLPFGRLRGECAVLFELLKARFGRYDAVCLHSQGLGWRAGLIFAGPLFGMRLAYHNADYYDPIAYPLRTRLERRLARKSRLLISHEYHRGYILRAQYQLRCPILISPPNLPAAWPIPPRSDALRAEMAGAAGPDAFLLRLHGGFDPRRMTAGLFQALTLLPPRFRLVMTDGGPEAARLFGSLSLGDRIVMLPQLDYAGMLTYTASADAGVLLYSNNDLGNYFQAPGRLTEYLACGLPVLAPRYAGIENLVLRYGIGRCVNPASPASIAAGLLDLERDIRSGRTTPAEIRRLFEVHFAYEHWIPAVSAAFDDMLNAKGRRAQAPPPEYWFPELNAQSE